MTDAYSYIPKPVGANYTNLNAVGKQQYDQADITFDSASVFYDGVDNAAYISVAKPIGTPYTNIPKPTL